MTQKPYDNIIDEQPSTLAKWIRYVTKLRLEDIGNTDATNKALATLTASAVAYDPTSSGMAATDVQAAIDELKADIPTIPTTIVSFKRQVISSTGTYTPSTGMLYCDVELQGSGGGGGGTNGAAAVGGTGGGGGYAKKRYTAAEIGANAAVTLGAGGAAGANTGGTGGTGTDSTFDPAGSGVTLTAAGGAGGNGSTSAVGAATAGGAGGTATNGDINIPGCPGSYAWNSNNGTVPGGLAGGGNSFYGQGPQQLFFVGFPAAANGTAGTGYGAGGGGSNGASKTGAAGLLGICIITEYCSV